MIWSTKTEFVDLETAQELTADHVKKGLYVVVRTTAGKTHISKCKTYGIKHIIKQCERNRQGDLFK